MGWILTRCGAVLALAFLAGCSLDLEVPEQLPRGGLKGTLDTHSRIPPGDLLVRLTEASGGKRYEGRTDSEGVFEVNELPPGAYLVSVDAPGFAPLREGPFSVVAGETHDVGRLVPTWLAHTSSEALLTGTVIIAGATSGGADAGQLPSEAQGATVAFLLEGANNAKIDEVTVSAFGTFSVRLPPGTYTLQVSHPYYVSEVRPGVALGAGETKDLSADPLVLELNPALVSGKVWLDRDGVVVAGAGVTITSDTGLSAVADPQGRFELGGLAAGRRILTFTLTDYSAPPLSVTLGAAERRTLDDVTLTIERGEVQGEVEMADGTPIQQVTVDLVGVPYSVSVAPSSTPSRGTFSIKNVPVGVYSVRASRPSYIAAVSGAVTVRRAPAANAGTLKLTRIQGDFVIDDGDSTNTPGYTRVTDVSLVLTNVTSAAQYRVAEGSATALASATYQQFTSTTIPYTLSSGDGTKTVYLQFKDASGNESAPLSASVVLDQASPLNPKLEIANGAPFTRIANPLPVTLTAEDADSGLAYVRLASAPTVDANGELTAPRVAYVRDTTFTRPTSADGVQNVYAQFIDNAGNFSAVVSASIVIDTTAPTGALSISNGPAATLAGYTNSLLAELSLTPGGVEPNGGYLLIRLANDPADLANATLQPVRAKLAWFLDPNGEGTKTVHYQYVDAAGNPSGAGQATITYDATPPQVTATRTSPALTNDRTVSLSLSVVELRPLSPTAGLTLSENALFSGATPGPYPSNNLATYQVSAGDGPKTVFVRVRDAAGNDGAASVGLTLDQTPPGGLGISLMGALADGTPSSTLTSAATVTVTLTESGASGYLLGDATLSSCPATGYQPLTSPVITGHTLTGTTNPRTVRACFTDGAGNTAGPVSATINVDGSAPTGCALVLSGRRADGSATTLDKTAQRDVSFTLTGCTQTPAEIFLTEGAVTCSSTGSFPWQPFNPASAELTLSMNDGTKTVRGCVRDLARNTSSLVADSLVLDTTPPAGASVLIDNGAAYVNAAQKAARGGVNQVSVAGTATGAVEWAISETSTPATFTAFPGTSPQSFVFSAGDGVKTIRALFRDDVGNVSVGEVTDSIEFDTAAPAGGSLGIAGNGYTNTPVIAVNVTAPTGADTFELVESSTGTCTTSTFGSAIRRALVPTTTFITTPGDGTKTLCARFFDGADNPGSPTTPATVVLDTTPPSKPQIITSPQLLGPSAPLTFNVTLAGPVTDANLAGYEVVGGTLVNWTAQVPAGNTFTFTLATNSAVASGVANVLRVRARDHAGNVSAEDSVVVTVDTSPPARPTLNTTWVDNGDGESTLYWTPSTSPDVKGYLVYYAGTSQNGVLANYRGTGVVQGNSPFFVPTSASLPNYRATLSGLANGSPLYVTVAAVDHVDQLSLPPLSPSEVILEPNVVSLNRLSVLPLPGSPAKNISRMAVQGDYLYLGSADGFSCTAVGQAHDTFLTVVELSSLKSPVQGGQPQSVTPPPIVHGPTALSGAVCAMSYGTETIAPDLLIDGNWLFYLSGPLLRVFSLANPESPVQVGTTLNLASFSGGSGTQLALIGDTLFVTGSRLSTGTASVVALSVAKLYDSDAATFPVAALQPTGDIIGTVPLFYNTLASASVVTRDRMVVFFRNTASADSLLLGPALDNNTLTPWNASTARIGYTAQFPMVTSPPRAAGNHLFTGTSFDGTLEVHDLRTLWNASVGGVGLSNSDRIVALGISSRGTPTVEGPQVLLADESGSGVRSADVSDFSAIANTGYNRTTFGTSVTATYGPYLLAGAGPELHVFELATPRTPHEIGGALGQGALADVANGFAYAGTSHVLDLQNVGSSPRPLVSTPTPDCVYESTRFDDVVVSAAGSVLRVAEVERLTDRDPATSLLASNQYTIAAPAGVTATSVKAYGNHLVVAERRADGVWLEVLDARPLRDRQTSPAFSWASQTRGAVRLASFTPTTTLWATVTVAAGRAFVGLDDQAGAPPSPNLYVADIRPLLDDVAGGSIVPLGSAAVSRVQSIAVVGDHAYVGTYILPNGLQVVNVTPVMQEPPTALSNPTITSLPIGRVQAVEAYGTYAVVLSRDLVTSGIYGLDISSPHPPRVLGYAPVSFTTTGCTIGTMIYQRFGLRVRGTRAYLVGYDGARVLELE